MKKINVDHPDFKKKIEFLMANIQERLFECNELQNAADPADDSGYVEALEYSLAFQFLAQYYADICKENIMLLYDASLNKTSNN